MRILGRLGLAVCGLTLVVSPSARAQSAPPASAPAGQPGSQAPGHHHKGLFAWRHCVECQRAWVKKHDGVDVPPPPSLPPGAVPGPATAAHTHPGTCQACQAGMAPGGAVTMVDSTPGHAVVGGPQMVDAGAPGYAVVGEGAPGMPEADPSPVGVAGMGRPQWGGPRMASAGPRPYDPAVLPSSMIPPQTALDGATTSRPHIISHLLGVSAIGRQHREARARRSREQHASIAYDPPAQPVTELPASVVYGNRR
jgi:hypothetical protein